MGWILSLILRLSRIQENMFNPFCLHMFVVPIASIFINTQNHLSRQQTFLLQLFVFPLFISPFQFLVHSILNVQCSTKCPNQNMLLILEFVNENVWKYEELKYVQLLCRRCSVVINGMSRLASVVILQEDHAYVILGLEYDNSIWCGSSN